MKIRAFQFNKKKKKIIPSQNIKYKSCLSPDNNKKKTQTFFSVSLISIQTQQHIKKGKKKSSPPSFFPLKPQIQKKEPKHCIQLQQQQI